MTKITVVGAETIDRDSTGNHRGGSVFYSEAAYAAMGATVELKKPNYQFVFENHYDAQHRRTQFCESNTFEPFEPSWAEVVHLMPVMGEVELHPEWVARKPRNGFLAVNAQGFLRDRERSDKFLQRVISSAFRFPDGVDALFFSEEDVADRDVFVAEHQHIPLLIETRGASGALIMSREQTFVIGALDVPVEDPTGAGDVFAATFVAGLRFREQTLKRAAQFATAASSFVIGAHGRSGITSLGFDELAMAADGVNVYVE